MRYGEAGQSHLLPFLGAAALFAALTIMAHSVVLGLAANGLVQALLGPDT